jgi:hypothetical protein
MAVMDKPRVVAWWMDGEPVSDDDPWAAVKHRAHAIGQAAGVLAEVTRSAEVKARADAIDQVTEMLLDEAFDPGETWDAAEAAGMPVEMIDAAGNVALALWQIEHHRD